jgi:SAM-dependent methyltransferase
MTSSPQEGEFWRWSGDGNDMPTTLNCKTAEAITNHYSFYLKNGMNVLEFGAGEDSYLPQELRLASHVGVSAAAGTLESNKRLTKRIVANLNDVIVDVGVRSDEVSALQNNSFDVILLANTVDFLTHPREVFRTAWRLLKPGTGIMIVPFSSKDAVYNKIENFGSMQTKMWKDFNDEQHMWVIGSFFQFSAGEGWEGLKGFDVSPKEAVELNLVNKLLQGDNAPTKMFVVQARKEMVSDAVKEGEELKYFKAKLYMSPTMEDRDKQLLAPRLVRLYKNMRKRRMEKMGMESNSINNGSTTRNENESDNEEILPKNLKLLPEIYKILIKMDQFAFPFNLQAQLATDLIGNSRFTGSEIQLLALSRGLGLTELDSKFWPIIGSQTGEMEAADRVNLLAHIVPEFSSDNNSNAATAGTDASLELMSFASGLEATYASIRERNIKTEKKDYLSEAEVQMLGTELLACEVLSGSSSRRDFAAYVSELTSEELEGILKERKQCNIESREEMIFLKEREGGVGKDLQTQVSSGRGGQGRTMKFNEEKGRMEEVLK